MKLSRDFTLWIHFLFDQCVPPVVRDSKWFMWLPFKLLFRDEAKTFFTFKEQAPFLSQEQFRDIYHRATPLFIQRETDLNAASIAEIERRMIGDRVLDIACGRGFLTKRLATKYHLTAADIILDPALVRDHPHITWREANLEHLPFDDDAFDTVICAHTLEHVQHPAEAIRELRRVTAQRLIVVVPKQRPYRYTFDLHLHFFPYAHDLLTMMGRTTNRQNCESVGGDWLYIEDRESKKLAPTTAPL